MTMYRKKTGEPFWAWQWHPDKMPYPDGVSYNAGDQWAMLDKQEPLCAGDWVVQRLGRRQVVTEPDFAENFEPALDPLAAVQSDPGFVVDVTHLDGNNNGKFRNGRRNFHIRGLRGNSGEDESIMSVAVETEQNEHYPESGRIIVGTPRASPLLDGHLPDLGGFCGSPDAVERYALVLLHACALARAAIAKGK